MDKQKAEITGKSTSGSLVCLIELPKNKSMLNPAFDHKIEEPCPCLIFNSKKNEKQI